MREILFRGKRNDNGNWVEGSYVKMPTEEICIMTDKIETKFVFGILPETRGQYTGLTDKNGVKIFEGDILKTRTYGKISDNIIVNGFDTFAVIYKPCMFRLVNRNRRFNFVNIRRDQLEVIGNIYDNPELMGGEIK